MPPRLPTAPARIGDVEREFEAVEASLAGDVARAFDKLGENVAEVKPDNLAGAAAARWLALSPKERANAGLMAPSHGLRENINGIVRERLVRDGRGTFRLEDGRSLDLAPGDPQLRYVDRAWASTVHAFQGRTVDTVIAAMEANHPHLITQKSFYV